LIRIVKVTGFIVAVFMLMVSLLFTGPGTRYLIDLVNRLTPVEIGYESGSLLSALEIGFFRLQLDDVDVQLHAVSLDLDLSCLWVSKICFQKVQLGQLDIVTVPGAGESPASKSDAAAQQRYEFPVDVEADDITISQASVRWEGGDWSNGLTRASVAINGSTILLRNVSSEGAHLRMLSNAVAFEDRPARIELPAINIPLELVVTGAVLESPRWSFGDVQHRHSQITLDATWVNNRLSIDKATATSEQWGHISLAAALVFEHDWPVQVDADLGLEQPPLWPQLHGRNLQLSVAGTLGELLVDVTVPGQESYGVAGTIDALDKYAAFDFAIAANWDGPRSLQSFSVDVEPLSDLELLSPWKLEVHGTVEKQLFSLVGQAAGLGYKNLELKLAGEQAVGAFEFSSVSLVDELSASAVDASGNFNFGETLSWQFELSAPHFTLPQMSDDLNGWLEGVMHFTGSWQSADSWTLGLADMNLQGELNNTPAEISGGVQLGSGWLLGPSDLEILANSSRLTVKATDNELPNISLEVPDISRWLADSAGSISLNSRTSDSQRQLLFTGEATDIAIQGVTTPMATLEGSFLLAENQAFELAVSLASLQYAGWNLHDVQLALQGDEKARVATLSSHGDVETEIHLEGRSSAEDWLGQLRPAVVGTRLGDWQLQGPVELAWDGESVSMQDHCWLQLGSENTASLCFENTLLGEQSKGLVDLRIDLQFVDIPAPYKAQGLVNTVAQFSWSPESGLLGSTETELSRGALFRDSSAGSQVVVDWDKAVFLADLSGGKAGIHGDFWRDGRSQANFNMQLPVSGQGVIDGAMGFDSFVLDGVLKPFYPQLSRHSGELEGKLVLSGTVTEPLLNGQLRLLDGSGTLVGNPTEMKQLNLAVNAYGRQADIEGDFLLGGGPGTIAGRLDIQPELTLDLTVDGSRHKLLWPPGIEAVVSENLNLVVSAQHGSNIKGLITVHRGLLEHEQLPAGSVDLSDDVVEVDYQGREISERSVYPFGADVRVAIEDAFRVEGSFLETRVGGDLSLKKLPFLPLQVFGELNIIEGEIDAFGQQLDIRRGNLSFAGSPDNPDLNIRAERNILAENIQVGVLVQGDLEDVSFELYSSTPMPEAEMLSYLVRGRGVDRGAGPDGSTVALSVGLGAVNQTGVVRSLNKIPGLSEVAFGTEGDAQDTAATLGGYIGDRIYLSYGVGVYEPINVLTARFYILSRLWLEVVSRLESSVDIYYSFDIQ
jgi:translocation and assembly module TamB